MATRIKSKTLVCVPQSKNEAAEQIKILGDLQREFERERATMNDGIAGLTQQHQPALAELQQRMDALMAGIQTWAEANRTQLCGENDRLGKTVNLVTGEVSWRVRPPSVSIRGVEQVLDTLLRMGLERFVRSKQEPDKEAMRLDPDAVRGIAGISIVTGQEDFIVRPFEAHAEAGA
ncbi:host-nuclease inhibitor Gam family protein [Serpentinimonas maccroryi]|uniref:host-nuclease inhibitor Gam family protein n=1 Tax=Serpentinimonas maccroryi TaxID=1458426 RepID=UPI00203333BA|nr:host-nuclease inhibitor Gam family protein [Serpentinimonas maccroryi]MCM2480194.1 host-nuclease inhibitor protein Gam [Serpentinimonas maccroryi]